MGAARGIGKARLRPFPALPAARWGLDSNTVLVFEGGTGGSMWISVLRDLDEMVFIDPSGNTDQGV